MTYDDAANAGSPEPAPESGAQEQRVLGRLDFALRQLRPAPDGDALAARPLDARTALALSLGAAHLNGGALEAAEREFRDALAADPDNDEAHLHLARTLTLQGRLEEAERELAAAEQQGGALASGIRKELLRLRCEGNR